MMVDVSRRHNRHPVGTHLMRSRKRDPQRAKQSFAQHWILAVFTKLRFVAGMTVLLGFLLTPAPAHAQDCGTPTTSGLVGYWMLDGDVTDSAGSNDGVFENGLSAADTVTGIVDQALAIDDDTTNKFIRIPFDASLETPEFTVSMWYKTDPNDPPGSLSRFIMKNGASNNDYSLRLDGGTGQIWAEIRTDGSTWDYINPVIPNSLDGNWHLVTMSYDGNIQRLYFDGAQVGGDNVVGGTLNMSGVDFSIGDRLVGGWNIKSDLDDIRIYDRALSDEEIVQLYKYGLGDEGAMIFNKDSAAIEYCDGTDWVHAGLGSYNPNAVEFDGANDYINQSSVMTDSSKITGSLWVRNGDGGDYRFIEESFSDFFIRYQNNQIRFVGHNTSGTFVLGCDSSTAYGDNEWHHILFSFDMSNSSNQHIYIDGVNDPASCYNYVTSSILKLDGNFNIGVDDALTAYFNGNLADVWMDSGTYIDFSIEENRRKFISETGMPMYLGADGSLPLGKAPDIFLSGDTENWHVNKGTGGGFTENGEITYSSSRPGDDTASTYTPVSSGLVGHWPMNETSGDVVDLINGNNGTEVGTGTVTYGVNAPLGTGINLSGDSVNFEVGNVPEASITGAITVAGWFNWDGTVDDQIFISKRGSSGNRGYRLEANGSGAPIMAISPDGTNLEESGFSSVAMTPGQWHHVVGVFEPSTRVSVYVDGVKTNENTTGISASIYNSTQSLHFGNWNAGASGSNFTGSMDDVRIYNRVLSDEEIAQLYNTCSDSRKGAMKYDESYNVMSYCNGVEWVAMGPVGGTPPTDGLVGHWELDETSGTIAYDSAGSNDGTMVGGLDAGDDSDTGVIGNALQFDGVNDYINIPNDPSLQPTAAVTLSAWVNMVSDTSPNSDKAIIGLGTDAPRYYVTGSGEPYNLKVRFETAVDTRDFTGTTDIWEGIWYHLALTYDGAQIRTYINGVEESNVATTGAILTNVDDHRIGDWTSGNRVSNMIIDDARVYDRALSDAEIQQLYQYGLSGGLGDVDNGCSDEGPVTGADAEGFMFYNIDNNVMQYCNGEEWIGIGQ